MQVDPTAAMRHQQQVLAQLQQIVQSSFGAALELLAPGYKATVLFTFKGRPERDIVFAQASLEDVLSSLLAKATPAQVAAIQNKDFSSNKPLNTGPTAEDRLAAVRKAMAFLPHMPATSFFREQMTKALTQDVPSSVPQPTVSAVSNDAPRDEIDTAQAQCVGSECPNCGSRSLFKALGSGHIVCEECDCDLTECSW